MTEDDFNDDDVVMDSAPMTPPPPPPPGTPYEGIEKKDVPSIFVVRAPIPSAPRPPLHSPSMEISSSLSTSSSSLKKNLPPPKPRGLTSNSILSLPPIPIGLPSRTTTSHPGLRDEKDNVHKLKTELEKARQEVEESKQRARDAEEKLQELENRLKTGDENFQTLKSSQEKASKELDKMRQEAETLRKQATSFQMEVQSLRELKDLEMKKLREEMQQSEGVTAKREAELNVRIQELELESSEKESRLRELDSEILRMRNAIESGEKKQRRASELVRRISSLQLELENSNSKIEQSVRHLSEFKVKAEEEKKRELSMYDEKIKDLENQINVISREDMLQTQNEALEKRLREEIHASFEKERVRLCDELEELRKRKNERENEAEIKLKKMSLEYDEMKKRVREAEEELKREREAASRRRRLSMSDPTLAPTHDESIRNDAKMVARKASLWAAQRDLEIQELAMKQYVREQGDVMTRDRLENLAQDRIVSLLQREVSPTKKEKKTNPPVVNDSTIYRVLINSEPLKKKQEASVYDSIMRRRRERLLELRFEIERLAKRRDMMRCSVELARANRNLRQQIVDMMSSITYVLECEYHVVSLSLFLFVLQYTTTKTIKTGTFVRAEENLMNS